MDADRPYPWTFCWCGTATHAPHFSWCALHETVPADLRVREAPAAGAAP